MRAEYVCKRCGCVFFRHARRGHRRVCPECGSRRWRHRRLAERVHGLVLVCCVLLAPVLAGPGACDDEARLRQDLQLQTCTRACRGEGNEGDCIQSCMLDEQE